MRKVLLAVTILLLAKAAIVHGTVADTQMGTTLVWQYKAADRIDSLRFSEDGYLGAASKDGCAYVFDPNGTLVNKICGNGDMYYVSYSNGVFVFINADGYVYFVNKQGELIKKIFVGSYATVSATPYGFIACGYECTYFDPNGTVIWSTDVGYVDNDPAYYKGYWFVPDEWGKLTIIDNSTGIAIAERAYSSGLVDTASCGNYLALTTLGDLYLYDINVTATNGSIYLNLMWRKDVGTPTQISFSKDCRYIAVANTWNNGYLIYDLNGNLLLDYRYGTASIDDTDNMVTSIAWYGNTTLAVGLNDGRIYVYKLYSVKSLPVGMMDTTDTKAPINPAVLNGIPAVTLMAPIVAGLLRRRNRKRSSS